MLNLLISFAFFESVAADTTKIKCAFPGEDLAQKPIHVVLEPRPSLKDQPGLFRVMMEMNGRVSLRAMAQPIASTAERDVLIRGRVGTSSTYTVGLRDDGRAAFNMQTRTSEDAEVNKLTRIGECRGFETYIMKWLPS